MAEDIVDRLNYIAYREQIDLEPDAAVYLARLADGGLRDAVSLLDQCASAATGAVDTEQVCKTLGLAGAQKTAELMHAVGSHDAAKALSIFSAQYAEGKDLAAMLDELCTVARDLLILRTASKDVSMISGICTQKELKELLPMFTAEELLRMTSLLRDAASGFNTSANRRIDAELCLLRLCKPEAAADAQSLNARISRLEEKIASGTFVQQSAPAAAQKQQKEETPPWKDEDDDQPPFPDDPPPAQEASVIDNFWVSLVQRLRTALKPPVVGMFADSEGSPVLGRLRGDELVLTLRVETFRNYINKPEVLQTVAECASAVAGRRIRVTLAGSAQKAERTDGLDRLISFGAQHPDIIELK
ncbi:MAG: hypothetical protein ACI3VU_00610, partial [Faecousia sp.]